MGKNKLTTARGRPYAEFDNSQSDGNRGPVLLQDYFLHKDVAHFNRERIPERVVHAKGAGAFGTGTGTHDITQYTNAKLFSKIGKQTEIFARFATEGGEKGGVNYDQIPVNQCCSEDANCQRDGFMQVGDNGDSNPYYRPYSFDGIVAAKSYKEPPMQLESNIAD